MLQRAFPLVLLLACPAVVFSQAPPYLPPAEQPAEVAAAPNAEQLRQQEELKRLLASRDELTQQIDRLRKLTGRHQQVVVSVQVCELSRTQLQAAQLDIPGFDFEQLQAGGFAKAVAAGMFNPPNPDAAPQPTSNFLPSKVIENDQLLRKVIAELKQARILRILAEPTVSTVSGQPASFLSGGEFPVPVAQKDGTTAVEHRTYGTQLDVVPAVLGQGKIKVDLRPRISELDPALNVTVGDQTVPGLRVRGLNTSVEMQAGQTLVLGGLFQERKSPVKPAAEAGQPTELKWGDSEMIELILIARVDVLDQA